MEASHLNWHVYHTVDRQFYVKIFDSCHNALIRKHENHNYGDPPGDPKHDGQVFTRGSRTSHCICTAMWPKPSENATWAKRAN